MTAAANHMPDSTSQKSRSTTSRAERLVALREAGDLPTNGQDLIGWIADRFILSGALAPGEQMPSERLLAEALGVGRPLVREALRRLVERRLVDVRPGRGTFVRHLQTTDAAGPLTTLMRDRNATAADVLQARIMLETEAAITACRHLTIEATREIRAALQRFEDSETLEERVRSDLAFHRALVMASGNPVIGILYDSMATMTVQMMLRSLGDPIVSREGLPFHQEIFDALLSGNEEKTARAVRGHLLVAERCYGSDLDKSIAEIARRELGRLLGPGVSIADLMELAP